MDLKPIEGDRTYTLDRDAKLPEGGRTRWIYRRLTIDDMSEARERATERTKGVADVNPIQYALGVCLRGLTRVENLTCGGQSLAYPDKQGERRTWLGRVPFDVLDELAVAITKDSGLTEDEVRD